MQATARWWLTISSICPEGKSAGRGYRWLAAIALSVSLAPPAYALNPSRLLQQYIRNRWTEEQGYPGGAVHALAETPDGYLWIGGQKGLVRFDGLDFQLFDHANTPAIPESAVLDLAVDAQGALWIRLENRELVRYHGGAFDPVLNSSGYTAMSQGANHDVILERPFRFVHIRNGSLDAVDSPAAGLLVISVAQTRDGTIWTGTRDTGLYGSTAGRVFEPSGVPDRKVNCLLATGDTLWAGTDRGLAKWNGTRFTQDGVPAVLRRTQVLTMAEDRDSNLWLGTSHGLLRIASSGTSPADQLPGKRIGPVSALFEDREGDLWVGSSQGIERYRDSVFLTYPPAVAGSSEDGGPVYVDPAGHTWHAPPTGGLYLLEGAAWRPVTAAGLNNDVVYSIDGGPDGIWVGRQSGGLTHLRIENGAPQAETFTAADGLAHGSIYSVHCSRDGAVWAGSLDSGVSRIRDGRITTYTSSGGLASNTISAIAEGPGGAMWFATPNGLEEFVRDQWKRLASDSDLPPGRINCLTVDSSGILWIGTDNGIAYLRGGVARIPRDLPQSANDPILGIADDGRDGLWIATPRSVARLSRSHLLGQAAGAGPVRTFGSADGIPLPEGVRRDRSVVNDAAGRIWFSLGRGVSVVDAGRLNPAPAPAIVHIESVTVDGNPLNPGAPLKIRAGGQRIRFHYVGLSLAVPERVRYRYRLDSFDRGWSEPTALRETVYTNLAAGSYRFRVIASNSEGIWNSAESSVGLEVIPAVWQTFWFRGLVVLACGLLSLAVYRMRLRRVTRQLAIRYEERLAERTRIGQELHDTLLQGLLAASMQLHVAVEALPAESPSRKQFGRVLAMMRQVVNESRNAVRGLRSSDASARDLHSAFSRVSEEFVAAESVEFRIVVDGETRPLSPLIRDEVYRIGREALVNAFRHSGSSTIEMQICYSADLRLSVRDQGRGIDQEILRSGRDGHFGLVGMRERAEGIGAQLKMWSRAQAGTEVLLTVPGHIAFARLDPPRQRQWLPVWRRKRTTEEQPAVDKEEKV